MRSCHRRDDAQPKSRGRPARPQAALTPPTSLSPPASRTRVAAQPTSTSPPNRAPPTLRPPASCTQPAKLCRPPRSVNPSFTPRSATSQPPRSTRPPANPSRRQPLSARPNAARRLSCGSGGFWGTIRNSQSPTGSIFTIFIFLGLWLNNDDGDRHVKIKKQ